MTPEHPASGPVPATPTSARQSATRKSSARSRLAGILLLLLGLCGSIESLTETLAVHTQNAFTSWDRFIGRSVDTFRQSLPEEYRVGGPAAVRRTPLARLSGALTFAEAQEQLIASMQNTETSAAPAEVLCRALIQSLHAAELSGAIPRLQLAVADFASRLARLKTSCADRSPEEMDTLSRNRLALVSQLAPYDTDMLYLSALVYLRLGDKSSALENMRLSRQINPFFSEQQQQFFYHLVSSPEELERALSGELRNVMSWAEYLRQSDPDRFNEWREYFLKALRDRLAHFTFAASPDERQAQIEELSILARMPLVVLDDAARSSLDLLVSQIHDERDAGAAARLFKERAALRRIPVLKSFLFSDPQPAEGMLHAWVTDAQVESIRLARSGFTFGFYLPPGYTASLVLIENERMRWRVQEDELELWVSDDNRTYTRLTTSYSLQGFKLGRRELIALRFPGSSEAEVSHGGTNPVEEKRGLDRRYFKLQYRSGATAGHLRNEALHLLQVYGAAHTSEVQ